MLLHKTCFYQKVSRQVCRTIFWWVAKGQPEECRSWLGIDEKTWQGQEKSSRNSRWNALFRVYLATLRWQETFSSKNFFLDPIMFSHLLSQDLYHPVHLARTLGRSKSYFLTIMVESSLLELFVVTYGLANHIIWTSCSLPKTKCLLQFFNFMGEGAHLPPAPDIEEICSLTTRVLSTLKINTKSLAKPSTNNLPMTNVVSTHCAEVPPPQATRIFPLILGSGV